MVLAWSPSTDDSAVAGYHVYRGATYAGDAAGTGFVDLSGLGGPWTVVAFDTSANVSPASAAVSP